MAISEWFARYFDPNTDVGRSNRAIIGKLEEESLAGDSRLDFYEQSAIMNRIFDISGANAIRRRQFSNPNAVNSGFQVNRLKQILTGGAGASGNWPWTSPGQNLFSDFAMSRLGSSGNPFASSRDIFDIVNQPQGEGVNTDVQNFLNTGLTPGDAGNMFASSRAPTASMFDNFARNRTVNQLEGLTAGEIETQGGGAAVLKNAMGSNNGLNAQVYNQTVAPVYQDLNSNYVNALTALNPEAAALMQAGHPGSWVKIKDWTVAQVLHNNFRFWNTSDPSERPEAGIARAQMGPKAVTFFQKNGYWPTIEEVQSGQVFLDKKYTYLPT